MIPVDIRKAIRHLKTELGTMNQAIGALEDRLEQLLATKYEKHMRKVAGPADEAAALVLSAPAFESTQFHGTTRQRLERLRNSEWNVWFQ